MDAQPSTKRRAFIALGGSALFSGCISLDVGNPDQQTPTDSNPDQETPIPELDNSVLQQAASQDVPETGTASPVTITEEHLENGRVRARALLDQYEDRVDDVDESAEKEEMREMASRAENALQASTTARTKMRALTNVRAARADATEALWTARAALDEASLDDALDTRDPVRDRLRDLRNRNWYVGPSVDTTLVGAYKVEEWTNACETALSAAETQEAFLDAYRIGKTAERVETARAFLDDASYFVDQLRTGETTDFEASFTGVIETVAHPLTETVLEEEIDAGYSINPEEMFDHEISNASAELVSRAAGGTAYHTNWMERYERRDGVAGALLYAIAGHRDLSIFEDIRTAVEENGDAYPRFETADRVDTAKDDVVAAIAEARQTPTYPSVEAFLIRRLAIEISNADHRMETVLDGAHTRDQIYDAALELWGAPTLAGKRLAEQPTAVTNLFEQIEGSES